MLILAVKQKVVSLFYVEIKKITHHIFQPEKNSSPSDSKASHKTIYTEPDRRKAREEPGMHCHRRLLPKQSSDGAGTKINNS